jgi:hypothetical protein
MRWTNLAGLTTLTMSVDLVTGVFARSSGELYADLQAGATA